MPTHDTNEQATAKGPSTDRPAAAREIEGGSSLAVLPLRRATSAAAGAAPEHHRAAHRATPAALVRLQRAAGNAAVATYMQRKPCGCPSCSCEEETQPAAEPPVQRDLADVAAAVLPQWVSDVVAGVPATARSLAGAVSGGASSLEGTVAGAGNQAGGRLESDTRARAAGAESDAQADAGAAETAARSVGADAARESGRTESAATALPSAGPLAGSLLNPANPTIDLDQVMRTADRIGALVKAVPGGAAQLAGDVKEAVVAGTAADGQPGWNCDQAEVMAMAGGVRKAVANAAVRAGKAVLGPERYDRLVAFVDEKVASVQRTVAGIRKGIRGFVDDLAKRWDEWSKPYAKRIDEFIKSASEKWQKLTTRIRSFMDDTLKRAGKIWSDIERDYITPFVAGARAAKQKFDGAIDRGIKSLGSWWAKLPGGLKAALLGAAAIVAGPVGIAVAAGVKAVQFLMSKKDKIFAFIRQKVDGVISSIGAWYQKARARLEKAVADLRERGRKLLEKGRAAAAKAAALVDQHTPQWVKNLRAAAENMRKKIAGEACTALGETAGPCAEQFVPDLGPNPAEGASHNVTVQASGELAAVVYGVPVKVAGGASVALSRVGKVYTVVVSGQGAVAVTTPSKGGGGEAKVEVELPGALGDAQKAWKALTGQSKPATPAAPGAPTAPAPAGALPAGAPGAGASAPGAAPVAAPAAAAKPSGAAQDVSAEAGYKGNVEMTYVFDGTKKGADNTCDGVGGMTAMLAGLGVGALLPAPFNAVGAAAQGDYSNHLTACSITLSQYGNAKVDVKSEGVGGIEAAISAEQGVKIERARQANPDGTFSDEWVDTATIFGSLGGSLGASLLLRAEPPIAIGGKATASGKISATLSYSEKQGTIKAMSVSGTATFGMKASIPEMKQILPEAVALVVEKALEPYLQLAGGTLQATAKLTFDNLQDLLSAIDTYVTAKGATANSQDLIDIVVTHFSQKGNLKSTLSVVLKVSKTQAKVSAAAGGDGYSGKAEVSVTENQTIPLYSG